MPQLPTLLEIVAVIALVVGLLAREALVVAAAVAAVLVAAALLLRLT